MIEQFLRISIGGCAVTVWAMPISACDETQDRSGAKENEFAKTDLRLPYLRQRSPASPVP